jgi:NTP pyrophosphatase (non-canonical NTP hydrolase)
VEIRLLKLTEEIGEVADAFLGVHGLNRRKASAAPVTTFSTSFPT